MLLVSFAGGLAALLPFIDGVSAAPADAKSGQYLPLLGGSNPDSSFPNSGYGGVSPVSASTLSIDNNLFFQLIQELVQGLLSSTGGSVADSGIKKEDQKLQAREAQPPNLLGGTNPLSGLTDKFPSAPSVAAPAIPSVEAPSAPAIPPVQAPSAVPVVGGVQSGLPVSETTLPSVPAADLLTSKSPLSAVPVDLPAAAVPTTPLSATALPIDLTSNVPVAPLPAGATSELPAAPSADLPVSGLPTPGAEVAPTALPAASPSVVVPLIAVPPASNLPKPSGVETLTGSSPASVAGDAIPGTGSLPDLIGNAKTDITQSIGLDSRSSIAVAIIALLLHVLSFDQSRLAKPATPTQSLVARSPQLAGISPHLSAAPSAVPGLTSVPGGISPLNSLPVYPPTPNIPTGNLPISNPPTGNLPTGNLPTGNLPTGNLPTGVPPTNSPFSSLTGLTTALGDVNIGATVGTIAGLFSVAQPDSIFYYLQNSLIAGVPPLLAALPVVNEVAPLFATVQLQCALNPGKYCDAANLKDLASLQSAAAALNPKDTATVSSIATAPSPLKNQDLPSFVVARLVNFLGNLDVLSSQVSDFPGSVAHLILVEVGLL